MSNQNNTCFPILACICGYSGPLINIRGDAMCPKCRECVAVTIDNYKSAIGLQGRMLERAHKKLRGRKQANSQLNHAVLRLKDENRRLRNRKDEILEICRELETEVQLYRARSDES